MPSVRRSVIINRPIDEVFTFFTTHSNDVKWRPHVKEISASRTPAVGERIHQVVPGPGGRGIPADLEVTAFERPTHYAFQVVAGPVRPRGDFVFTTTGDGATEVALSLSADLGGLKKLLMGGSVQKAMEGEVAGLDTAKRLLEGS
ncbi:MAG TPA: SRPBCC family protein [Intrasporangium sp.]|nr:SRPBCC family protein [Intrasporangium sp.]